MFDNGPAIWQSTRRSKNKIRQASCWTIQPNGPAVCHLWIKTNEPTRAGSSWILFLQRSMIKEGCVKGYYLHLVCFLVLIGQPWWSYLYFWSICVSYYNISLSPSILFYSILFYCYVMPSLLRKFKNI